MPGSRFESNNSLLQSRAVEFVATMFQFILRNGRAVRRTPYVRGTCLFSALLSSSILFLSCLLCVAIDRSKETREKEEENERRNEGEEEKRTEKNE